MSISELPEGFNPHKGIKRVFEGRRKMMESGEGIDWGFAEALAFGTLVSEGGHPVPTTLLFTVAPPPPFPSLPPSTLSFLFVTDFVGTSSCGVGALSPAPFPGGVEPKH